MNILVFILVSVSITSIIQNEAIFSWFRKIVKKLSIKLYNFITCATCLGFWIGVLCSFFFVIHPDFYVNMLVSGFISSLMNKLYVSSGLSGFSID